jgi:putative hydrolase of the HAD superfamily
MSEPDFIALIAEGLSEVLGRPVSLDGYGARLMASLEPNEPLLGHYRALRERGVRLAILTNNVREWHDAWRAKIPAVDELFELIVDSGFEGTRKPEPEIYALTLSRLGLAARDCAFVDDVEVNVVAAREAGMQGIHFRDTAQVITELDALVA